MTANTRLRDFMRRYVKNQHEATKYDAWLQDKVQHSQASADAGKLIPASEVEAQFAARRLKTRLNIERLT